MASSESNTEIVNDKLFQINDILFNLMLYYLDTSLLANSELFSDQIKFI